MPRKLGRRLIEELRARPSSGWDGRRFARRQRDRPELTAREWEVLGAHRSAAADVGGRTAARHLRGHGPTPCLLGDPQARRPEPLERRRLLSGRSTRGSMTGGARTARLPPAPTHGAGAVVGLLRTGTAARGLRAAARRAAATAPARCPRSASMRASTSQCFQLVRSRPRHGARRRRRAPPSPSRSSTSARWTYPVAAQGATSTAWSRRPPPRRGPRRSAALARPHLHGGGEHGELDGQASSAATASGARRTIARRRGRRPAPAATRPERERHAATAVDSHIQSTPAQTQYTSSAAAAPGRGAAAGVVGRPYRGAHGRRAGACRAPDDKARARAARARSGSRGTASGRRGRSTRGAGRGSRRTRTSPRRCPERIAPRTCPARRSRARAGAAERRAARRVAGERRVGLWKLPMPGSRERGSHGDGGRAAPRRRRRRARRARAGDMRTARCRPAR